MKNDMIFWNSKQKIQYGIAISMDLKNSLFGWKALIYENNFLINSVEYGQSIPRVCKPPVIKQSNKVNRPIILNIEDFYRLVSTKINHCVFYTGAGISIKSGIWDLNQIREALLINDFEKFYWSIYNDKCYFLKICKIFANQLYNTEPSNAHYILKDLQKQYNFKILTENIDILHQKSGAKVITRDKIKQYPFIVAKKSMIIIGLSDDHINLVRYYRLQNKNSPLYIVNPGTIPKYVRKGDFLLQCDAEEFLIYLQKRVLV